MSKTHYSLDGKTFEYQTLTDALAVLLDGAEEGILTFYSGKVGKVPSRDILHLDFIDELNDGAFDKFYDLGFDDPLYDFGLDEGDKLSSELNEVVFQAIDQWFDKSGIKPNFSDDMEVTKHYVEFNFDADGLPGHRIVESPVIHAHIPDHMMVCDFDGFRFQVNNESPGDQANQYWTARITNLSSGEVQTHNVHEYIHHLSCANAMAMAIDQFNGIDYWINDPLNKHLIELADQFQAFKRELTPALPEDFHAAVDRVRSLWSDAA